MAFIIVVLLLLTVLNDTESARDKDACGRSLTYRQPSISEDYTLQKMLLKGFRAEKPSGVNSYSSRKGGFTRDGSNRQCIAVTYNIKCGENTTTICEQCDNSTTEGSRLYLWTTFNGTTDNGNLLLKLNALDLRVFGFELCDIYNNQVNINITLEDKESVSPGCYDLNAALIDFTTLLPGLSSQLGNEEDPEDLKYPKTPTPIGFAIRWCEKDYLIKNGDKDIKKFSIILVFTSKFFIIMFCYEIYHQLRDRRVHRKTHDWYYVYWSAQLLVIVGMGLLIDFARKHQKNHIAFQIFYASLISDGVLTFFVTTALVLIGAQCCKGQHGNGSQTEEQEDQESFGRESGASNKDGDHKSSTAASGASDKDDRSDLTAASGASSNDDTSDHPKSKAASSLVTLEGQGTGDTTSGTLTTSSRREEVIDVEDDIDLIAPPLGCICTCLCQFCNYHTEPSRVPTEDTPLIQKDTKVKCYRSLWKILLNGISLFSFLAFLSYLTQAIPSIAISYYLSPTASLIRLGFFELVIIVMLGEGAYLLYLLDKFWWIIHIHCNGTIPNEILEEDNEKGHKSDDSNAQSNSGEFKVDDTGKGSNASGKKVKYIDRYLVNPQNIESPKLIPLPFIRKSQYSLSCKKFHWLFVTTFFQIVAFGFAIYVSWKVLHFILILIVEQTANETNKFTDILAILPTIAINGWLLFKKGDVLHILKDIVGEIMSSMEHRNHHNPDR